MLKFDLRLVAAGLHRQTGLFGKQKRQGLAWVLQIDFAPIQVDVKTRFGRIIGVAAVACRTAEKLASQAGIAGLSSRVNGSVCKIAAIRRASCITSVSAALRGEVGSAASGRSKSMTIWFDAGVCAWPVDRPPKRGLDIVLGKLLMILLLICTTTIAVSHTPAKK